MKKTVLFFIVLFTAALSGLQAAGVNEDTDTLSIASLSLGEAESLFVFVCSDGILMRAKDDNGVRLKEAKMDYERSWKVISGSGEYPALKTIEDMIRIMLLGVVMKETQQAVSVTQNGEYKHSNDISIEAMRRKIEGGELPEDYFSSGVKIVFGVPTEEVVSTPSPPARVLREKHL